MFIIGCATTHKTEVLVRYPIKGEIVEIDYKYKKSEKYFIIDYEDIVKLKTATGGSLEEK